MTLPLIVYRSLRQHLLSTLITVMSIALAAGLLICVWVVKTQSQQAFITTTGGFDAVLGARGSKLQLVLNAVFNLEASPGNLAWSDYLYAKRLPLVKTAIPIAVGDNLKGYRLVGTVKDYFSVEYKPGSTYQIEPGGRIFDENAKEAVAGSFAAEKLGLKVGDTFHPFHGLAYNPNETHSDVFTVVGILAPSNTPTDRTVLIPIHGLQTMSGHDPRAATDISAVLIQLRSPTTGFFLDQMYNKQGDRLTFAFPVAAIISDLFSRISWFDKVLSLIAYLVAVIAAGSVLASIYNSMSARRRDLAILRALGARRSTIFGSVVIEASAIGLMGSILGFVVYAVLFVVVAKIIRSQTGVVLDLRQLHPVLWICPLAMTALCGLGGVIPAIKAYRTPVAETLAPTS